VDKMGLFLVDGENKTKFNQLTGDLVDIAIRSYEHEGKTKFQYALMVKDIDKQTGEESIYTVHVSENSNHCISLLNSICNLQDPCNLEFSYYISGKYLNPTLRQAKSPINWADRTARANAEKIGWAFEHSECPKPQKQTFHGVDVLIYTEVEKFWREKVAEAYQRLFGKKWEFWLGETKTPPTPTQQPTAPQQPPAPPTTAPATDGVLGEEQFKKLLGSIESLVTKVDFDALIPKLYKRVADLGCKFTTEQLARIINSVKIFAAKKEIGMAVDVEKSDAREALFYLYFEDLPF